MATDRQKKDYDVPSNAWRTVAAYPLRATLCVGTLLWLRLSAIARSESPRDPLR